MVNPCYILAVGGFDGGAEQRSQTDSPYKRIFITCLRHRGHKVLN